MTWTSKTLVWGVAADDAGIIQYTRYGSKPLPGGGLRAWKEVEHAREPASAYASTHDRPMPMRWGHNEEIGRIVALRRAHGRLYAVAETEELEPADLAGLTEKFGDLRWSTSTNNRRSEKLRIDEISLTPAPASIGLPAVKWWKLDVVKGNPPQWVRDDLARAEKMEIRHRRELVVHDVDFERNPGSDQERFARELGLIPGTREGGRSIYLDGERVPLEHRPGGRIISVR